NGRVVAVDAAGNLVATGLNAFPDGFFNGGKVRFLTGPLAGRGFDLDGHEQRNGGVLLSFWLPPDEAPLPGDSFSVTAGCDKSFATCRHTFANQLNFRGFPHLPGADFAYSYASGGHTHDGGALFP
ncbi:phage BR0599 family protein, partial [Agrobacterium pusense]